MALDRPATLGHAVGFCPFHMPPFHQACLSKDVRGKNCSLAANADDQYIKTFAHFFPSRTIAPTGQSCMQTAQPLHSSLILAFSSANSMAGHPKRTQVWQAVHTSGLTMYFPRFTPARRAVITHICFAIMTFTPLRFFASCKTVIIPVISYGSTLSTKLTPHARHSASRDTGGLSTPHAVTPVFGFGWCPVIAVIRLSRITTVIFAPL